MYSSPALCGAREPGRVVMDIIDGRPWIASHIRNNNLRQHCHMLGRTFRRGWFVFGPSRARCRRLLAVVMARSGLLTAVHPTTLGTVPLLLRMAWYGKWWQRQPEDWVPDPALRPEDQWRSLARHLFCREGVRFPEFFESAWLTHGTLSHMERDLYCHAAAGLRLRDSKDLPPSVSARALEFAMRSPAHFTIREALRRGQVLALGGSQQLVMEVLGNRMAQDFGHDRIWLRLIEKIAADGRALDGDFGMAADVLMPLAKQCQWSRIDQLLKLPSGDLRRHLLRYWTKRMEYCASMGEKVRVPEVRWEGVRRWLDSMVSVQWQPMPGMPKFDAFPHGEWDWEIHQLTSHLELAADYREMKCWRTESCRAFLKGELAVFSFRLGDAGAGGVFERCFTVVVTLSSRQICHITAGTNRWVELRQAPVVREWALRKGLTSVWRE